MPLYEDLLKMGKDAVDALQRPFKVKKEHKNLELKILELESQIAKDDLAIQEQKSANPIDWDTLINAINKKDLNERKLKQLRSLELEMFIGKTLAP